MEVNFVEILKVFGFPTAALIFVFVVLKRGDAVTRQHHLDVVDLWKQKCNDLTEDRNYWRIHSEGLQNKLERFANVTQTAVEVAGKAVSKP